MRATAPTFTLLAALLTGVCGCSTYNYMRQATPRMERTRVDWVASHPTATHNDKIISGQVTPGMTREEVLVSWGRPDHVRPRSMAPDGVVIDERWKYREDASVPSPSTFLLTFKGDLLDQIEVNRGYSPFSTKVEDTDFTGEILPRETGDKSVP